MTPASIKTFADVLAHLAEQPYVRMESPNSRVTLDEAPHRFLAVEDGYMWFRDGKGRGHHLPIDCGMTGAESGIRVRPDGFDFTKFGITIYVTFWPEANS